MDALVKNYMTEQVHSIRSGETILHAKQMMDKGQFRHLPVLEGKKVVGIISDRDLSLVDLYPDMDIKHSKVEELMMQYVSTFRPDDQLSTVVTEMAENKYGCVVITDDNDQLKGIFTSIDALRILAKVYNTH